MDCVNRRGEFGRIALHQARRNQSKYTVDVMKILIKHESHVDETDQWGMTTLGGAVGGDAENTTRPWR